MTTRNNQARYVHCKTCSAVYAATHAKFEKGKHICLGCGSADTYTKGGNNTTLMERNQADVQDKHWSGKSTMACHTCSDTGEPCPSNCNARLTPTPRS